MKEKIIYFTEGLLYVVAGVFAIIMHQIAMDYANSQRLYDTIGGEIFVPILVYGVMYFLIKYGADFIRNFKSKKKMRREEFLKYTSLQAQATLKKNGTVIVYNRNGSVEKFPSMAQFIEDLK